MRFNGFQLTERLRKINDERLIELEIGSRYVYQHKEVILHAIRVNPSFKIVRKFLFWETVIPTVSVTVTLEEPGSPNGMVVRRIFGVELDDFVKNLKDYYQFQNDLIKVTTTQSTD
jgi:hypothetical protein